MDLSLSVTNHQLARLRRMRLVASRDESRLTYYRVTDAGANIKLWNGDSVGRWEGNTLVIDVTNVNGYTWFDDAGNFYTDAAHLVERLTMIDPNTIHYEVTIEDPKAYTRPWKMVWALVREAPGFELLEEACLEGERDLPHFLEGGLRHYFGETWKSR